METPAQGGDWGYQADLGRDGHPPWMGLGCQVGGGCRMRRSGGGRQEVRVQLGGCSQAGAFPPPPPWPSCSCCQR